MISKEDLLPGTNALYGIEFESIIIDIDNGNLICIKNDKLYNKNLQKSVTTSIYKFMEDLPNYEIPELFQYHMSGLNCYIAGIDKRLEFASYALLPTKHKPSELFNTLEQMRDAFYDWSDEKYYLPDHGTISLLSDDKKVVYTTLTGGTHMTISFPLTIHDNPVTWKYFMWLFLGLVTMYQPIYIALNCAPSNKTKGSERQRRSGSLVVGSAYIYDIFKAESGRYEMFINSPSEGYGLPDYPNYAHWNDKNLKYKETGPWRGSTKSDIGISHYTRSDSFKLIQNNSFILEDKKNILYKQFYNDNFNYTQIYGNLISDLSSMTSNLIEFRFFDNEPTKDLLNKFNLLVRMADYAYEQSKNMEESVGISGLSDFLEHQIDNHLNIRPLVNTKAWHDAVLESMNEGIDATFKEEFIDECYEFLNLTQFSTFLENPEMKQISAIDLNKAFVYEMNTAEHHFSEYFQTDNPTSDYSKKYQIQQIKNSKHTAEDKKKAHEEKVAREEGEERQRLTRKNEERRHQIEIILNENIVSKGEGFNDFILKYIDKKKLTQLLRFKIYDDNDTLKELIKYGADELIEDSLVESTSDENLIKTLTDWIKESLLPDLRQKEPKLKEHEDKEYRRIERERERERRIERERERERQLQRERERERERQLQREREVIEQQMNFIVNIVTKNIEKITNEKLKDLILTTIHLRKISDMLRKAIYVDKITATFMEINCPGYIYISLLDDIIWDQIPQEKQNLLDEWFRTSLLPDLESNIQEFRERSQPQITMVHGTLQNEDERKSKIRSIIIETINRLNDEFQHAVITTVSYNKLTDVLYSRLYVHQQSFDELEELSDLIIKDATPESTTRTTDEDKTVKAWFKVGLLSALSRALLTERAETRRCGNTIEHIHASHEYWHPEIRIHHDQSNLP